MPNYVQMSVIWHKTEPIFHIILHRTGTLSFSILLFLVTSAQIADKIKLTILDALYVDSNMQSVSFTFLLLTILTYSVRKALQNDILF